MPVPTSVGHSLVAVEVDLDLALAPPAVVQRMAEDADVGAEVAALAGDVRQDLEVLAQLGPALAAPGGVEVERVVRMLLADGGVDLVVELRQQPRSTRW